MSGRVVFQPSMFIQQRAEDTPLFNERPLSLHDITQKYGVFSDDDLAGVSPRLPSPRLRLVQPETSCIEGLAALLNRLCIFSCCNISVCCCETIPDLYTPHYDIAVDSSPWEILGDERSEEIESCI